MHPELIEKLTEIGFEKATDVQKEVIPLFLEGKDVFALAETGSGKTGAFAIPIIQKVLEKTSMAKSVEESFLILSPTRELAQQTFSFFEKVSDDLGVVAVNLIGGENYNQQEKNMSQKVHVIVGTPGRIKDMAKRKVVKLHEQTCVIFDEADRLFDMGFKKDIESIVQKTSPKRQLIMVSATSSPEIFKIVHKFKSNPVEVVLNEDNMIVENIDHQLAIMAGDEKFPYLVSTLRKHEDIYAIVFCNTQLQTHIVGEWLKAMNFKAEAISGRLTQNKRTKLMERFRSKETTILVCTDLASRGLDVKNLDLVVNFDLPNDPANYVHRIGRTGRAGESGLAVSLCAHSDCDNLEAIYKVIGEKIPKIEIKDEDFATDICPKPYVDLDKKSRDPKNSRGSKDSKKKETSSRKKTNEKKKKKPSQDQNPETRTPREKKKEQPMKPFTVTSYSLEEASKLALEHFKLDSADALEHIVLDKGSKKFMIFGPQEKTFEFRVSSLAKKKLTPFLQELMQKMQLDLEYGVFVEGKYLKIHLTGNDIGLVLTNRKQLLFAIELILRQFVSRNKEIPRETRVQVIAEGTNPKPEAATRKENSRRDDKPGPKGQSRNKRNGNKDSQAGKGRRRQRNSDEFLINLSNKLKGQVLETGEAQVTQTFNPAERRIIHEHLHDDPEVQTDSLGDGRFKRVRISLVGSTLTNIDENNTESAGLE